ncbi:unnamed protein product [Effrenium voratum]|nr:unnamed protein product [Effrenium voratum]
MNWQWCNQIYVSLCVILSMLRFASAATGNRASSQIGWEQQGKSAGRVFLAQVRVNSLTFKPGTGTSYPVFIMFVLRGAVAFLAVFAAAGSECPEEEVAMQVNLMQAKLQLQRTGELQQSDMHVSSGMSAFLHGVEQLEQRMKSLEAKVDAKLAAQSEAEGDTETTGGDFQEGSESKESRFDTQENLKDNEQQEGSN